MSNLRRPALSGGMASLGRLRGVSRPLLALTLVVLCHNLVWIVALPAWQGPDEFSHYAYVERLAADHRLMPLDDADPSAQASAASYYSFAATGFDPLRFRTGVRPFGAAALDRTRFPLEPDNLRQHNTGSLGANSYPPAYYIAALPFFELPGLSNATERDYAVRLLSALLGALVVLLTYRLGRVVGLSSRGSLVAGALATSAPIMTQQSAVFSPDILLVVAVTGLAAATLRARDRLDGRRIAYVLAWGTLAALTKPIGLPAAVAVALPIAILTLGQVRRRVRLALLGGFSLAGVVLGSAFASTIFGIAVPASVSWVDRIKFIGEYLWQYYLPRPSGMPVVVPPATPASPPAAWMWGNEGVGILGWLTTMLPAWTYRLAWTPTLVAGGIAFAGGLFGPARDRSRRSGVLALVVASLAYILVLHGSEAVIMMTNGNRLLQGRYFLPIYPLAAVAIIAGLARFSERIALSVGLVVLAAWALVDLEALNTVLVYFG